MSGEIVPSYQALSVYADCGEVGEADECLVYYRKEDETAYTVGYPAVYLQPDGTYQKPQYAASILNLEEDTNYIVRMLLKKDGETIGSYTQAVTTLSSDFPISNTYTISSFQSGTGAVIQGLHGSENGYIRIVGDRTIDAGERVDSAIYLEDCSYIILDGITVRGGFKNGITFANGTCGHVAVRNCDISGWGRTGTVTVVDYNEQYGSNIIHIIDKNGDAINMDAGIRLVDVNDVLVEQCLIHEPRGNSTPWRGSRDGVSWTFSHPQGMSGLLVRGQRLTVRYNDIIGSETHRFNDAIEGWGNFSAGGGFAKDCDIYGNYLAMSEDDSIELDGGARNVRMYGNRMVATRTGISAVPNWYGPLYIFNNLLHDMRDSGGRTEYVIKCGNEVAYNGVMHVFHNTFIGGNTKGIGNNRYFNAVTRNNIWENNSPSLYTIGYTEREGGVNSFDYDLLYNRGGTTLYPEGTETNGIVRAPIYTRAADGKYLLTSASPGRGKAVAIPGFNFEDSDVGAYGRDANFMLPYRPMQVYTDKDYLRMTSNSTAEVTVTSKEGEALSYQVISCDTGESGVLTCDKTSGVLESGESVKLSIRAKAFSFSKTYGDELFVIKFSNGYSIPIGVRLGG